MPPITDETWLRRALHLAEHGWGQVHPNPLVGAVVVRDGRVVGEGWHARFGAAHAEPMALAAAGELARGATLYVTLEPCAHQGKTPPCTEAIMASGIARVVCAMRDPNPAATGGLERLQDAGIAVEVGMLADEARRLNARFVHLHGAPARPFLAVKLAVSMDGCVADAEGRSQWLSGSEAREWVHHERAGHAAIGIGAATAIADDARLTVRGTVTPRIAPTRVIFDRSGRLPVAHGIFTDAATVPVVIVRGLGAPSIPTQPGVSELRAADLADALTALAERGLDSLLVEGGGRLAGALLGAGLVDRVYQIQSPLWLGAGRPAWPGLGTPPLSGAARWRTVARRALGDDTLLVLER
jgi:diaminohydroxyphosphoribosylaminopyrimidine deaminase / 5-amino-6-(5-phosphoribosylamino)uracil reductase